MNTYSVEDIKQAIEKAKTDEIATSFVKLFPEVPDWESFIMLIDKEIHDTEYTAVNQSPFEERNINRVTIRNLFYLMVWMSDGDSIKEIKPLKKLFSEVFGAELETVGAFINIIGGEKPGEAHRDNRETIFWQCQGASQWTIYEDPEGPDYVTSELKVKKTIKLRPGDVLYLRDRGMHSVENFGPRASLAFMPSKGDNFE
jgi:mannose-6-phosphate isomerase-like protein (cupin superfamily)